MEMPITIIDIITTGIDTTMDIIVTITTTMVATIHTLMEEVTMAVDTTIHIIATIIMHIVHLHIGEEMDMHQIISKMEILQL